MNNNNNNKSTPQSELKDIQENATQAAKEQKNEIVQAAKEQKNEIVDAAKQQKDEALSRGKKYLNNQKQSLSSEVTAVADALRKAANTHNEESESNLGNYLQKGAEKIESLNNRYLDRDVDDIFRDVKQFAKTNPKLVAGACLVGGLALTRFFKSSQQEQQSASVDMPTGSVRKTGLVSNTEPAYADKTTGASEFSRGSAVNTASFGNDTDTNLTKIN